MSDSERSLWDILGTEPTGDERALKRAYAKRLKVTRPEDDPAGFQELRDAYEYALRNAAAIAEYVQQQAGVQGTAPMELPPAVSSVNADNGQTESAPPEPPEGPPAELWGIIAHEELRPVPPPARPPELWGVVDLDPAEEAAAMWQECVARASHTDPARLLDELLQREALLKFDVREEFELCALRYCAAPGYALPLRNALFAALGWHHDFAYLARGHNELVRSAVQRMRADASLAHFREHRDQYPGLDCIMSQQEPSAYTRQLFDRKLTLQLRALLQTIRWQHGEMLAYQLDGELFERWEHAVFSKRYFSQTALASCGLGFVLHFMLSGVLDAGGWRLDDIGSTASLLGFQALAFVLLALHAFGQPAPVFAWAASVQERLAQRWPGRPGLLQLGWIAPFMLLALLLLVPERGSALHFLVSAGLCVAALLANAANHALLRGRQLGCLLTAFVIAMIFTLDQHDQHNQGLAMIDGITLLYGLQVLALRSMAGLYADLGGNESALPRLRAAWAIGCAAGLLAVYWRAAPLPVLGGLMFAWACAGLLLLPAQLSWRAAWPLVFMPGLVSFLLAGQDGTLSVLALSKLCAALLLAVLYFTVHHLYLLHRMSAKPDGLA